MTQPPLVSIGLPTYNRAEPLERAARSVLAQDWENVELVISDNGSTDETRAVCEALRDRDTRVVYLRQMANHGSLWNFREVLARARGELFMWLGDDDWLDTTYVSQCARVLVENADYTLVCGRARYYHRDAFAFAERPVNLHASSSVRRLVGFYRQVTLNGAFYGVRRHELALRLGYPEGIGGDWLLVAHHAYLGKVLTLNTTAVHRALGGTSKSAASLAELHGGSPRAGNWQLAVGANAFRDVRRDQTYDGLSGARRLVLAVEVSALVAARFSPKAWAAAILQRLGVYARARRALERRRRRLEQG